MRLAFFGDIMGRSGRVVAKEHIPALRRRLKLDFVVVNSENAAGGFGVTDSVCRELFECDIDVLTSGNHAYDQRDCLDLYDTEPRLLRPVNFPSDNPGRGAGIFTLPDDRRVLVVNVQLQRGMEPINDPFAAVDREVETARLGQDVDAIVVDMHGEATSEKNGMGQFLDGRATLVVGTHTHIPTADAHILTRGTAYQTDAGMTGDYDSVIGMNREEPLHRFIHKMSTGRYSPAAGPGTLCGVVVETDDSTGLAKRMAPVRIGGVLEQTIPDF